AEDHLADAFAHSRDIGKRGLRLGDHVPVARTVFLDHDTHARSPRDWRRGAGSLESPTCSDSKKSRCRTNADKRNKSDYFVTMDDQSDLQDNGMAAARSTGGLEALIGRAARAGKGAAPVERWNPEFCGDIDM